LNNSNEKLAITNISSSYKGKDGTWIPFSQTRVGQRGGFYSYSWNDRPNFTMEGKSQCELAISSVTMINSRQFQKVRRAHKSLPQLLEIRITFEDSEGKKSMVEIPFMNEPLQLDTREYKEMKENKSIKFEYWIECDDDEMEARIWMYVIWDEKQARLIIHRGNSFSYIYLSTLKKYAFQGVQEKKEELELMDMTKEENGTLKKVFALIDLQNQRTYAFKFLLQTTTSSVVDYYLIPKYPLPKV